MTWLKIPGFVTTTRGNQGFQVDKSLNAVLNSGLLLGSRHGRRNFTEYPSTQP